MDDSSPALPVPSVPPPSSQSSRRLSSSPYTPTEQQSVSALFSSQKLMQALGFAKSRDLFPEAEAYRLQTTSTSCILNDLDRFKALYPPERYGAKRHLPLFEDKGIFYKDLDPEVALRVRGGESVEPPKKVDQVSSGRLSPTTGNFYTHAKENRTSGRRSSAVFAAAAPPSSSPAFSSDAPVDLPEADLDPYDDDDADKDPEGDLAFVSRIDIFSHRVSGCEALHEAAVGKGAYVKGCREAGVLPNKNFLERLARRHVDLDHALLEGRAVRAIAAAMRTNRNIVYLDLSYNQMDDGAASALFDALTENPAVRTLVLSGNSLSRDCCPALSSYLHSSVSTLSTLKLRDNRLDDCAALLIAKPLSQPGRPLTHLDLANNKFGARGGAALLHALASDSSNVLHLDLGDNRLGVVERQVAASAVKLSGGVSLEDDDVGTRPLSSGAQTAKGKQPPPTLRGVHKDLSDFKLFLKALPQTLLSLRLVDLSLAGANLGDALGLAVALLLNPDSHPTKRPLLRLSVASNKLSRISGVSIASALANNCFLTSLDLSRNAMGLEATFKVIEALETNTVLKELNVTETSGEQKDVLAEGGDKRELWERNSWGVSKALIEAAMERRKKAEEEKLKADSALEAKAVTAPAKKDAKKKADKKPAKAAGKGKPAKEVVDLRPIPKQFFVEASEVLLNAPVAKKGARPASAGPKAGGASKAPPAKKGGGAPVVVAAAAQPAGPAVAVVALPLPWQRPLAPEKRDQTVLNREDISKIFWKKVNSILAAREGRNETKCQVTADDLYENEKMSGVRLN